LVSLMRSERDRAHQPSNEPFFSPSGTSVNWAKQLPSRFDYVFFNLGDEERLFHRSYGNFADRAGARNKIYDRVFRWVFTEEAIESTPPVIRLTRNFHTDLTFGDSIVTSKLLGAATLLPLAGFVLICFCPSLPRLVTHRTFCSNEPSVLWLLLEQMDSRFSRVYSRLLATRKATGRELRR
jgi:hypothetical protein